MFGSMSLGEVNYVGLCRSLRASVRLAPQCLAAARQCGPGWHRDLEIGQERNTRRASRAGKRGLRNGRGCEAHARAVSGYFDFLRVSI
jgi:hypothetical protein